MISKLRAIYSGTSLNIAAQGIIYIPILEDCALKRFDIRREGTISGEAVFAVQRNGSGIDDINQTIPANENLAAFEDWNLNLVRGDIITLNFISGSIDSFVTLNLEVEDGESGGGSGGSGITSGDVTVNVEGHATVTAVQGRNIENIPLPGMLADDFSEISTVVYDVTGDITSADGKARIITNSPSLGENLLTKSGFNLSEGKFFEIDLKSLTTTPSTGTPSSYAYFRIERADDYNRNIEFRFTNRDGGNGYGSISVWGTSLPAYNDFRFADEIFSVPVARRYRIIKDGNLKFQYRNVADDGWETMFAWTSPFDLSDLKLRIGARSNEGQEMNAQFDNLITNFELEDSMPDGAVMGVWSESEGKFKILSSEVFAAFIKPYLDALP